MGGGIVPGSVVLIGGDPGIGKSTLLLQAAIEMAKKNAVLYVSGEESERQIKMRAVRLLKGADGNAQIPFPDELFLVTETNLDVILEHVIEVKPELLIVNSIQTTYTSEKNLPPDRFHRSENRRLNCESLQNLPGLRFSS